MACAGVWRSSSWSWQQPLASSHQASLVGTEWTQPNDFYSWWFPFSDKITDALLLGVCVLVIWRPVAIFLAQTCRFFLCLSFIRPSDHIPSWLIGLRIKIQTSCCTAALSVDSCCFHSHRILCRCSNCRHQSHTRKLSATRERERGRNGSSSPCPVHKAHRTPPFR